MCVMDKKLLKFYFGVKVLIFGLIGSVWGGMVKKYEIIFTKKFADKKKVYIFALA